MKKYLWIILSLSAHCFVDARSIDSKNSAASALQLSVEKGLRLPVNFDQEKIKTFDVNERLSFYKVPGLSFALIDDGEISWAKGYGKISASSSELINANTVFQAASIAKPVTAFGVMRIKDQGLVDINIGIDKYLTSLTVPQGKQTAESVVTFKNILDHSSGLTGGGYLGYEKGQDIPTDVQTFMGLKPAITEPTNVESLPGTTVRYSGAGYTLAEIALSDIFEQPFERLMDDWVLSTLGMKNSSFDMGFPHTKSIQLALGHNSFGKEIKGGWRVHPEQAAAGLWSTPTDLAKLAIEMSKAYLGQSKLLSAASAKEMLTPVKPEQDLSDQFGGQPAMTFVVAGEGEQFLFKHGGGNIGYRCLMLMYPETGDGAVFMTNSDAGFGVGLEMIRAASFVYNWPNYKATTYQKRKVSSIKQEPLLGKYLFDSGWQVEIIQVSQADGIAVKFPNDDIYPLTGVKGKNNYVHEETGVDVSFNLAEAKTQLFLYNQTAYKQQ